VRFEDRHHGFLFGGPLLETEDGGRSWRLVGSAVPVIDVEVSHRAAYGLALDWPREQTARLYRVTATRAVRIGPVLRVDGRWPQLVVHGRAVYLLAPGAIGRRAILWASHDAGRSWRRLSAPCTWPGANGAALAAWSPSELALVCGSQPTTGHQAKAFYVSTDGGAHWRLTARIAFTPGYLTSLAAGSVNHWVLAEARDGLSAGFDSGQTWRPGLFAPTVADVEGWGYVAFIDRTHAVAVPWTLNGDVLAFSADAGHTWREVTFTTS
jgi:photosystem II stability/assembly factor-like uncharacterized protein